MNIVEVIWLFIIIIINIRVWHAVAMINGTASFDVAPGVLRLMKANGIFIYPISNNLFNF